jgi:hypothetical protein
MTTASIYLRAPAKVENNTVKENVGVSWFVYSIALGILSYYAPKTALAASLCITACQVHRFHQLVNSDQAQPQKIHAYALHACSVMSSIGCVFGFQCVPWLLSAFKAARHFHLLRCAGHSLVGFFMVGAGWGGTFAPFHNSEKKLSAMREWTEMKDYLENYPAEAKKTVSKILLFLSALIPDYISHENFLLNQFRSPQLKLEMIRKFFENIKLLPSIPEVGTQNWRHWTFAIHQFQQLSIESQLELAPLLARITNASTHEQRDQLPEEVKLVLLNEQLKGLNEIPSYGDEKLAEWISIFLKFGRHNLGQQAVLGSELLRLIQATDSEAAFEDGLEDVRAAALKHCLKRLAQDPFQQPLWPWADRLLKSLPMRKDLGADLAQATKTLKIDRLNWIPIPAKLALLHYYWETTHLFFEPPLSLELERSQLIYGLLPPLARQDREIEERLRVIANANAQNQIDKESDR